MQRPNWVLPEPDLDFLRTFGALRRRPLGALEGWIGEGVICKASRAITFPEGLVSTVFGRQLWKVWGVNKSFFHDGSGSAKLEISYKTVRKERAPQTSSVNHLVEEMLTRPVFVSGLEDHHEQVLGDVGPRIARKYWAASSPKKQLRSEAGSNLVRAGRPCVFIQHGSQRVGNIPPFARAFVLPIRYQDTAERLKVIEADATVRVFYWLMQFRGQYIPVFYCQHDETTTTEARNLRIFLSRMWTEIQCLSGVLRAISNGTIRLAARGEASALLQRYINETLKKIKRLGNSSTKIVGPDIYDLGYAVFEAFSGAEIAALERAMETMEFRQNLKRVVKEHSQGNVPTAAIYTNGGIFMSIKLGKGSQLNQIHPGANVGEIRGPDNREQTAIVNSRLTALSSELQALVAEAVRTGQIADDSEGTRSAKDVVAEVSKEKPDATKIIGALGVIDTALGHIAGIGEKFRGISDLIKGYL